MAKYKAIITQRDGTRICLELSCREYHAQKLKYVFSRTLDSGVYSDADVVACDALQAEAVPAKSPRRNRAPLLELGETKREQKGGTNER